MAERVQWAASPVLRDNVLGPDGTLVEGGEALLARNAVRRVEGAYGPYGRVGQDGVRPKFWYVRGEYYGDYTASVREDGQFLVEFHDRLDPEGVEDPEPMYGTLPSGESAPEPRSPDEAPPAADLETPDGGAGQEQPPEVEPGTAMGSSTGAEAPSEVSQERPQPVQDMAEAMEQAQQQAQAGVQSSEELHAHVRDLIDSAIQNGVPAGEVQQVLRQVTQGVPYYYECAQRYGQRQPQPGAPRQAQAQGQRQGQGQGQGD